MTNSLRDQLLKKGLVDEKKLKQVNSAERKKHKQQRKGKDAEPDEGKLLARQALAKKVERDRELNRQHREMAERKAVAAQIAQLIQLNRISQGEGEIAFNFVDAKKVKRLYVTANVRNQLSSGLLAIVTLNGRYEIVPTVVAEKIRQRDETCVIFYHKCAPSAQQEANDPYADYQIPDDLMW